MRSVRERGNLKCVEREQPFEDPALVCTMNTRVVVSELAKGSVRVLSVDTVTVDVGAPVHGSADRLSLPPGHSPRTASSRVGHDHTKKSFLDVVNDSGSQAHSQPRVKPLPIACSAPLVVCGPEVLENEEFNGLWPSLPNLHSWVKDLWKPLVEGKIVLYPCARGFFIASFDSTQ